MQNQTSLLCRYKICGRSYDMFCSKHVNFYHEFTRQYFNCNGHVIITPRQTNSTDSDTFSLQPRESVFFSFHNQKVTRNKIIATMTTEIKLASEDYFHFHSVIRCIENWIEKQRLSESCFHISNCMKL